MESAKIHFNVIFSKIDDLTERTSIELSQSQGRAMLCPEGTESLPKPGINPTRWARHMKTPETLFEDPRNAIRLLAEQAPATQA